MYYYFTIINKYLSTFSAHNLSDQLSLIYFNAPQYWGSPLSLTATNRSFNWHLIVAENSSGRPRCHENDQCLWLPCTWETADVSSEEDCVKCMECVLSRCEHLSAFIIKHISSWFYWQICDSITGKDTLPLDQFTWDTATKYKHGGPGEKLDVGFTIHNFLLVWLHNLLMALVSYSSEQRCFGLDNLSLICAEETADNDINELMGKKRKCSCGRVAKGQDFWSWVDNFFSSKIQLECGCQLAGSGWKQWVLP